MEHPAGDRATPDFLFDPPLVIHGKDIRWLNVKFSLFIPNVSFDSQSLFVRTAQKYVERFGHGAIVWTKCGFVKSLDKLIPGIMHLSYTVAHTGRRLKQMRKQPMLFPSGFDNGALALARAAPADYDDGNGRPSALGAAASSRGGQQLTVAPGAVTGGHDAHAEPAEDPLSSIHILRRVLAEKPWDKGHTIHNDSAASTSTSAPIVDARSLEVDVGAPTTNLQVRLADGSRKQVNANHTHTVLQLRTHISTLSPGLTFTLKVGFPPKPLPDEQLSLADANLLNETIVQTDARPQATGTVGDERDLATIFKKTGGMTSTGGMPRYAAPMQGTCWAWTTLAARAWELGARAHHQPNAA